MLAKVIESAQHRLIKHVVNLQTNRTYRHTSKTLFIEGKKLVSELGKTFPLKCLFTEKGCSLPENLLYEEHYFLSRPLFKKISKTQSPESFAAEIAMPEPKDLSKKKKLLALDKVSDPGNLGTLIRTALALSFEGIFLTTHSADLFNDKALRAAKGATFHLPYTQGETHQLLDLIAQSSYNAYIGDVKGEPLHKLSFSLPLVLILGSESQGVSPELKRCGQTTSIPLNAHAESLNVASAGAILMHTMRDLLWLK